VFAAIGAVIVAIVVVAVMSSGDDERAAGAGGEEEEPEGNPETHVGAIEPTGAAAPDRNEARDNAGGSAIDEAVGAERAVARGGDAGISPGRGPTSPVAVELGHSPASATSGARLGQARYLLDQQRERLPRIEQAIAEAERAGDNARLRTERERLAIARSRIAELETHATELETAAREDGTLADAEREGPRPVGVGTRPLR
jgi:hypothetical protein